MDKIYRLTRRFPACRQDLPVRFIPCRAGQGKVEADYPRRLNPGVGHIVAIAHPGYMQGFDRSFLFDDGHDIAQYLTGMVQVRQGVNHRYRGVCGQLLDHFLAESPDHHAIDVARHDPGHIFKRLRSRQLGIAAGEKNNLAAETVHRRLERHPCPGGRFFEDQADSLAHQLPMDLAGLLFLLQFNRPVNETKQLAFGKFL
ncbi:MAG: hypothetical protein ACD_75C00267G0002 [uncultured bacterium]|nr:MAG: hypothetical protein ACD_75C00267G0002 [uncultured bacterium]